MKKIKKILALVMAMAMVLGMTMTVFADENTAPTNATADVTILGIGINDADFKVMQIIEPEYKDGEFIGSYKWVKDLAEVEGSIIPTAGVDGGLSLVEGLNSKNVQNWAATGTMENKTVTADGNNAVKMSLTAGTWIIVATPKTNVNVVYNPMIASVYYTKTDDSGNTWTVTPGTLNATGKWGLATTDAYTKSTDLSTETDKKIGKLNEDGTFTAGQVNGEIGTSNTYQLTGIIPSYGADFFRPVVIDGEEVTRTVVFNLHDSLGASGGLEYQDNLVVKVGGSTITTEQNTNNAVYTLTYYKDINCIGDTTTTPAEAKSFKIEFASSYIESLAGAGDAARKVEVTYSAKITAAAVQNVAENTYKLYYTRTPGETTNEVESRTPIEKKEHTYTASINGTVKKVDSDRTTLLSGATFGLYKSYNTDTKAVSDPYTNVITEATTNGMVKFGGLEFDTQYYIKETAAPAGYSLSDKVYEVICTYDVNDLDQEGVLTKYTVSIKDVDSEADATVFAGVPYGGSATLDNNAFPIVNTTLASLPSTGGIGTTIFTIGGCAIMILAAALYFVSRRKAAK